MELYINFKGANYTLLINLDTNEVTIMYGMKDVTSDFSQNELEYILTNKEKLMV